MKNGKSRYAGPARLIAARADQFLAQNASTTVDIEKGDVVYFSGIYADAQLQIARCVDGAGGIEETMPAAVALHKIPAGGSFEGRVAKWGVFDLDTSASSVGAPVYMVDSLSAGSANVTLTAPAGSPVQVGYVLRVGNLAPNEADGGKILIYPTLV